MKMVIVPSEGMRKKLCLDWGSRTTKPPFSRPPHEAGWVEVAAGLFKSWEWGSTGRGGWRSHDAWNGNGTQKRIVEHAAGLLCEWWAAKGGLINASNAGQRPRQNVILPEDRAENGVVRSDLCKFHTADIHRLGIGAVCVCSCRSTNMHCTDGKGNDECAGERKTHDGKQIS